MESAGYDVKFQHRIGLGFPPENTTFETGPYVSGPCIYWRKKENG